MTIKVAINGYGNLGRAVERAVNAAEDMQAVAVFTRRNPKDLETAGTPVYSVSQMADFSGQVDVCICCGGSATDLRTQGPAAVKSLTLLILLILTPIFPPILPIWILPPRKRDILP